MNYYVDTAIIGGGPAGISCAISLQNKNISNLVIEKKHFPRDKTCGGLVTNKTFKLLSEILQLNLSDIDLTSTIICDSSNIVELYHCNQLLTRSNISKKLRFVKRNEFDNYLVTKYVELGGKLLENSSCKSIDLSNHRIVLKNNSIIEFKHLVVADGALSKTRRTLGYKNPKLGFCIETLIPKSKLPFSDGVKIYFGLIKKGYAWIFPSGDDLCIGLGGVYKKNIKYDILLKQFLASFGLDHNECVLKGAFVPYGKIVNQKYGLGNVMLVGDAAGFVDPIYGEGLYFAIASGIEAANAIITAKKEIKAEYLKRISPIIKIIKQGNILQNFFFQKYILNIFKKIIFQKNTFVGFYCDNQISEYNYSYSNLLRLFWDYKRRG